jgi:hypothetical protein
LSLCSHERRLRATNVTACIQGGHLQGGMGDDPDAPVLRYASLTFCANPTCEKVFASEVAQATR